jgi:hypothetical protein
VEAVPLWLKFFKEVEAMVEVLKKLKVIIMVENP